MKSKIKLPSQPEITPEIKEAVADVVANTCTSRVAPILRALITRGKVITTHNDPGEAASLPWANWINVAHGDPHDAPGLFVWILRDTFWRSAWLRTELIPRYITHLQLLNRTSEQTIERETAAMTNRDLRIDTINKFVNQYD